MLRLVDADRKSRPKPVDADPAHDVAARERFEHDVFGHGDAGFEDAERTAPPSLVLHATQHRRCRGDKSPEAGKNAGLEIRRMHRRPLGRPDQLYQPGQRTNGGVGRLKFGVRALVAEPACREMNEAGMTLFQRGKIECGAIRRIDVPAIEQDVASADQFGEAQGCGGIIRVEGDARFVEIEKRKPRAPPLRRQRCGAAQRIACGGFDFLDGCTEIGEQARAIARRGRAPDLDNAQMRQRAHHVSPWPNSQRKHAAGSVSCC